MKTDYQKLCLDLFGTDDVKELKEISQKLSKKNSRNAGRKKQFTSQDIEDIRSLLDQGTTINDIAKHYGTSRQIVSKYINNLPEIKDDYTLRIFYMYKQRICTIIDVDFLHENIIIENQTNDIFRRAFGVLESPTWQDFHYFLQERCFPKTRGNAKEILKELHLDSYDPIQIIEKTQGRISDDDMWMRFSYQDRKKA